MTSSAITTARHSEVIAQLLQITDYIPVASSVKAIVDLFAQKCWKPDTFSSFTSTYHQHLGEKENFRYIAAIPLLGNGILIIHDIYQSYVTNQNLAIMGQAAHGNSQSLEQFRLFSPAQKKKCLELYYRNALMDPSPTHEESLTFMRTLLCGKDGEDKDAVIHWYVQNIDNLPESEIRQLGRTKNLPAPLASRIADFYIETIVSYHQREFDLYSDTVRDARNRLSELLLNVSPSEKQRVLARMKNAALAGSFSAFSYLCGEEKFWSSPASFAEWLAQLALTPNSSMHSAAWMKLQSYLNSDADSVLASFAGMIKIPTLSKEKFLFIIQVFKTYLSRGTSAQKEVIHQAFHQLTESGNVKIIHMIASLYEERAGIGKAIPLYEKAAHGNHVDSILKMAHYCYKTGNIPGAKSWCSKVHNLPCSILQVAELQLIIMLIKRKENPQPEPFFFGRGPSGFRPHGFRVPESHPQAEKKKEAEADKAELSRVIGSFSTKAELAKNLKNWSQKGGHPDKGGTTEEFQRVYALAGKVKMDSGWN